MPLLFGDTFLIRRLSGSITDLCFSQSGTHIGASCLSPDRLDVHVWRTDGGGDPLHVGVPGGEGARGMSFEEDRSVLHLQWVAGGASALFRTCLDDGATEILSAFPSRWTKLAFDPVRDLVALGGPSVRVLTADARALVREIPIGMVESVADGGLALRFAPAGLWVYTAGELTLYDPTSGVMLDRRPGPARAAGELQVGGSLLFARGSGNAAGALTDLATGQRHLGWLLGEAGSSTQALSADGTLLAFLGGSGIQGFRLPSEEPMPEGPVGPPGSVTHAAAPRDGGWLGVATESRRERTTSIGWLRLVTA